MKEVCGREREEREGGEGREEREREEREREGGEGREERERDGGRRGKGRRASGEGDGVGDGAEEDLVPTLDAQLRGCGAGPP
jgi:hypothetical protein